MPIMSLAQRTVTSITWNIVATLTKAVVLFVRSVLLARWLPVEVFGVYGFAAAIVGLSVSVVNFGMGRAFMHRAPETENEEQAAAVHFTLKLIFTLVWGTLLIAGAFVFTDGLTRIALLLLTVTSGSVQLAETPKLVLARRVVHRRLALIEFANILLATVLALMLAWRGATLWALLAIDLVTPIVTLVTLYIWKPVWRPRVAWSLPTVRYFLRFGSLDFLASVLWMALDRIDDLWTGIYLGETSLGFYSRAYSFAIYPRVFLATPVNTVAGGALCELKGDRLRLSRAFFQFNALLVRSGFYLAGLMNLVAPEFIRLFLGARWLPMLSAFRLMLVFSLFDPLRKILSHLFGAVGRPAQVIPSLLIRLLVLVVGLFVLGPWLGIAGVALAMDVTLVVGTAILLWQARTHVDCSLVRLFAPPGLALSSAWGMATLNIAPSSDWCTGFAKTVVFSVVYGAVLLAIERRQVVRMLQLVGQLLRRNVHHET
jgi:O-antigen/teichoic acid export membrane protein